MSAMDRVLALQALTAVDDGTAGGNWQSTCSYAGCGGCSTVSITSCK